MKIIYKYELSSDSGGLTIPLPADAEVLTVQMQRAHVAMWVRLDPDAPRVPRRFASYQTGVSIPDVPQRFLGTVQQDDGEFVLHIFEVL
jgi:hypothetical protein